MVQSPAREFPVQWRRPEDVERLWVWDGMHCHRPLTPLSVDFALTILRWEGALTGSAIQPDDLPIFPNGFWYSPFAFPNPDQPRKPDADERDARTAAEAAKVRRLWTHRWLPRIRRIARFVSETDASSMSVDQLTDHVARCLDRAGHAFGITLYAAGPMFHGVEQLYKFCEEQLGPDGVALAGASVQGYANASSASEVALCRLARLAHRLGLDDAMRNLPNREQPAFLAATDSGRQFLAEFSMVMDRYGWRVPTWFELSEPSWREQAEAPWRLISVYLNDGGLDPAASLAKGAAARRAALRRIRAILAGSDGLSSFENLWRNARQFVPVSEGRALWQLSLGGLLRVPALALGRRLQDLRCLDSPDDVFYLRLDELARGPSQDWRSWVATRRADREHWLKVVPPMTIGARLRPVGTANGASGAPELPFGSRMIGGFGLEPSRDDRILKGHPASPGVARGPARIVESIDQADKVQAGDVLVCRFTTPSWSHLFSRVAAIVADSGGVLSHCAILAREYAIPCVPGVRVGTRRIRDGTTLTVDGTQGIVRIED